MTKKYEVKNPIARAWYEKANKFIDGLPVDDRAGHVLAFGSKELDAWVYYFDRLGWRPLMIEMLLDGRKKEARVPAQWPEWLDFGYEPPAEIPPHPRPSVPPRTVPPPNRPGRRANLFVHAGHPGYAEMVERARQADQADWKLDEKGRPGIWVPVTWYDGWKPRGGQVAEWRSPTDDALRAHYSAHNLGRRPKQP